MKKIIIDGTIGWDTTADEIKRQIDSAGGEDLEIEISSGGGFVFDGIQIFNYIRNYVGKTTAIVNGLAASIASYIAMSADELLVSDNSVFMIHNASAIEWGDYRAMLKMSNILNGLTDVIGKAYINKTGQTKKNIRNQMDEETWLFGEEIKDQGFADRVIETEKTEESQNSIVAQAKLAFNNVRAKMQKDKDAMKADFDQCSNYFIKNSLTPDKKIPKNEDEDKNELQGDLKMNLDELKAKHPELYNQLIQMGIDQEHSRVKAHMQFLNKGISVEYAKDAIEKGLPCKDEALAHYTSEALNAKELKDRVDESSKQEVIEAPKDSGKGEDKGEDKGEAEEDLFNRVMDISKKG